MVMVEFRDYLVKNGFSPVKAFYKKDEQNTLVLDLTFSKELSLIENKRLQKIIHSWMYTPELYIKKDMLDDSWDISNELRQACNDGNIELIKYIIEERGPDFAKIASVEAAFSGNLEILEYLYSIGTSFDEKCTFAASSKGYLEALRYLYSINTHFSSNCYDEPIRQKNIDILKYLYFIQVPFDFETLKKQSLSTLDFLYTNNFLSINDLFKIKDGLIEYTRFLFKKISIKAFIDDKKNISTLIDSVFLPKLYLRESCYNTSNRDIVELILSKEPDNLEAVKYLISLGASVLKSYQVCSPRINNFLKFYTGRRQRLLRNNKIKRIPIENSAAKIIQKYMYNWLYKPVTRDGKLGILARIGLRDIGIDSLYPL